MNTPIPAAPGSAAPAAPLTPAPTVTPTVEPHTKASISDAEAAQIARDIREDVAKGKITQTVADARFAELNTPVEQRAPDTRTAEQKQLDAQFPTAKASDYVLRYYTPGQEPPVMPKEVKEFDANARGWMVDMGLPRDFGNSLVQIITKSIEHQSTLSPVQRESYKEQENEKLRTLFGGQDKLDAALQPAAVMIDEVEQKRPGLKAFVLAHGDHAVFIAQLVQAARIYHARKQGR